VSATTIDSTRLRAALEKATAALLAERNEKGCWEGELSSSALSTATAVTALALALQHGASFQSAIRNPQSAIDSGLQWLSANANADGGWGDTTKSLSNISTTTLCWAAFGAVDGADEKFSAAVRSAEQWLVKNAGSVEPRQLSRAIIARYGKDRTFSVPILTMCALAGRLGRGRDAWRNVIPLPFELAACPHQLFAALRLPVVSYALPALIAIGQARHVHAPSRNPIARILRNATREKTLRVLTGIQPSNGGFLEATPLTSFVTMSLAGSGQANHIVTQRGLEFLTKSQRLDGSWPIDTNLETWCTTLSISALDDLLGKHLYGTNLFERWPPRVLQERAALRADERKVLALVQWLLNQQYRCVHPYTHAAPGGWAWTSLPGGVPDADDTAGANLALEAFRHFFQRDDLLELGATDLEERLSEAIQNGTRWLLNLQNSDGGFPTFCRGWGALPFDRSSPDITAHAIRALATSPDDWRQNERTRAVERATLFLVRSQRTDGTWVPLWFGNQFVTSEENPVYGTSRVLLGLVHGRALEAELKPAFGRAVAWLSSAQNGDGSWGGDRGVRGSIEETALAVEALASVAASDNTARAAVERGAAYLIHAVESDAWREPSPIGFYFAKLWYFERLYPLIFTVGALRAVMDELHLGPGD
jgi:squalene-hopene/tetraprenyl-beta-curcumene cyclase